MMTICYKIHQQGPDRVLAAADRSALGIKHADPPASIDAAGRTPPRRVLDLVMFRAFYDGEIIDEKKLAVLLADCSSANLVGERAVGVALKAGLARAEHVVRIGEVPHLQIYRLPD